MLNNPGITKVSAVDTRQILFNVDHQLSVGVVVGNTGVAANSEGKKILKAGTPVSGDILDRSTPFLLADLAGETLGVYTLRITTAFANDEVLTIQGIAYTKKATENVAKKEFGGATAANQITSLLKMVVAPGFTVTGATDTLTFTQVHPDTTNVPVATKTSVTGVIGAVTEATAPVNGASNAVGVMLHDVDVTAGDANGTVLLHGFVNLDRLEADVALMIYPQAVSALSMIKFLKDN